MWILRRNFQTGFSPQWEQNKKNWNIRSKANHQEMSNLIFYDCSYIHSFKRTLLVEICMCQTIWYFCRKNVIFLSELIVECERYVCTPKSERINKISAWSQKIQPLKVSWNLKKKLKSEKKLSKTMNICSMSFVMILSELNISI